MAQVYLITQEQMDNLNTRLELAMLRDENVMRFDDETVLDKFEKSSLYRSFNYVIRKWQQDMRT